MTTYSPPHEACVRARVVAFLLDQAPQSAFRDDALAELRGLIELLDRAAGIHADDSAPTSGLNESQGTNPQ
jgi:hypothetical protein